jgi:ABC-type thiamin/hydroxymethylpyrimidine transport system permease subunit
MMVKKMAGFFSLLGVIIFLGNWLYFSLSPDRGLVNPMDAETTWQVGIYLAAAFFLLGLFISTLGIALVQEVLVETRSRDMARKFRAKTIYNRAMTEAGRVGSETGEISEASSEPGEEQGR